MSDVLHAQVIDAAGQPVGEVEDIRLLQDGPMLTNFGAALRVDGLVVGRSSIGIRLGFDLHHVKGPWPLKAFFGRLERRGHYVRWDQIEALEDGVVRLRVPSDELAGLSSVIPAETP